MRLSRERSWFLFNWRVLQTTRRSDVPLLEKLKYIAIFANNTDEFFSARIYRLFLESRSAEKPPEDYLQLLQEIAGYVAAAARQFAKLKPDLESAGIRLLRPSELSPTEQRYFGAYLAEEVAPRTDLLDPAAINNLSSRALYFAAGKKHLRYLLRQPMQKRFLEVPGRSGAFVRLGALIRWRSDLFLPTPMPMYEMRLTRIAQLEAQRLDWEELPLALEARLDGHPSRLEVESGFPWKHPIAHTLGLLEEEVFELPPPLDLRLLFELAALQRPDLHFKPLRFRKRRGFSADPIAYLQRRDMLLYHPLDDYRQVVSFAEAAAQDPAVYRIRATLYRVGEDNPIMNALMAAADRGKRVEVLLEGRARFDELINLYWRLHLEGHGVEVLDYPPGKKVHAKLMLVESDHGDFAHLGTGNYNLQNGRLYSDVSYFTSRSKLTSDVASYFDALALGQEPQLKSLLCCGRARRYFLDKIAATAKAGGRIIIKVNHLTDEELLSALRDSAKKGARVQLVVRSTLTRVSPSFKAVSLVGRFLEHARIAAFQAAGRWEVWAGSADWMERNFDRRLEAFFPIVSAADRGAIVALLKKQLQDDVNAFILRPDGSQRPRWGGELNSQLYKV